MVTTRKVILILIGILTLIAFFIFWVRGIIYPRFSFPEREKLVRYYACMLAICTKGCNHEWLDENTTPNEVSMCVERDPATKECKKWCKDICEENGWLSECAQPGVCCNQSYNITVNLEGETQLKGIYWAMPLQSEIGNWYIEFKSEIQEIIQSLNKTENFPNFKNLVCQHYYDSTYATRYFTNPLTTIITKEEYCPYSKSPSNRSGGAIVRENEKIYYADYANAWKHKLWNYGIGIVGLGNIVLLPNESREIFGCLDGILYTPPFGRGQWIPTIDGPGFISCIFKGSLLLWPIDGEPLRNGGEICADVVIVSHKYRPDSFILTAEPAEQITPINNWASYKATIINKLYSYDEVEFTLDISPPKNVECEWIDNSETSIKIKVLNDTKMTLDFRCKASATGEYSIKVKAWGSVYSSFAFVKLSTTDYTLECSADCKQTLYANIQKTFDAVELKNNLGIDESFTLNLDQEGYSNILNCKFTESGSSVLKINVADENSYKIKLTCKPTGDAAGNSYKIKIISKPDNLEDLEKSRELELDIPECVGARDIVFFDSNNNEITSIPAGNKIRVDVKADGCNGRKVSLAINRSDYIISKGSISNEKYEYPGANIYKHVSTPGTYTFYAWVDINNDNLIDEGETYSENFVVNTPTSQSERDCTKCNNEMCVFSVGSVDCCIIPDKLANICDKCVDSFACSSPWDDANRPCEVSCDPQSCWMDDRIGSDDECAIYSSVCCISGNEKYYSNGPEMGSGSCDDYDNDVASCESYGCKWCGWRCVSYDMEGNLIWEWCSDNDESGGNTNCFYIGCESGEIILPSKTPCLSVDNLKEFKLTRNFFWRAVDNSKNILVKDSLNAIFKTSWPSTKSDCTGSFSLFAPSELSSANVYTVNLPKLGNKNVCKLSDSLPPYVSWLFLKVSSSRPIYGIRVSGSIKLFCDAFSGPCTQAYAHGWIYIFIHNSSGWFNVSRNYIYSTGEEEKFTFNLMPTNELAWKNVDSILIGGYAYVDQCCPYIPLKTPFYKDHEFYIDYIGLLTADKETPFCTDGSGNFNRIVNDAETCYWGLDCATSGNGWKYSGVATSTGFLEECDCSSRTCGYGYCEKVIDGNKFCFSGIKCMNGGWVFEKFEKCEAGKGCTAEGCK